VGIFTVFPLAQEIHDVTTVSLQVSIIIPARNEEVCLPDCLESIIQLDFPEEKYEVILVDNGSIDRTMEIARQYGARVFRNDTLNVSGLRNLGAQKARGKVLAFVDADCTVSPNWLSAAARYFNNDEVIAWGAPPGIPENSTWVQQTWYIVRRPFKKIMDVEWLESMNLFVRKDIFLSVNGFTENLTTCEDVDFCYRLKKFGRIVSDNRIEVTHHGEAKTIIEFFKKEVWRGSGNFQGVFSHGFSYKELPSLALPIYFLFFLPFVLTAMFYMQQPGWLFIFLFLWFLPGGLALLTKGKGKMSRNTAFRLFFLLQVYFLARTAAVFKLRSGR
jgi:glycosyltransferase involved in cell wall biosynthesis